MVTPTGTLRRPAPTGLLRLLLRAPLALYRLRLGWLLGKRFLRLDHMGRKSRIERSTVLEIIRHDPASGVCVIASGWGKSQWYRNVTADAAVKFTLGVRKRKAQAMRLSIDEAEWELRDYGRRHPMALRKLAKMMLGQPFSGDDREFHELARSLPMFRLVPTNGAPAGGAHSS
jgi:deazaflavin-dependent oxidoreductase (nitroreductase family)